MNNEIETQDRETEMDMLSPPSFESKANEAIDTISSMLKSTKKMIQFNLISMGILVVSVLFTFYYVEKTRKIVKEINTVNEKTSEFFMKETKSMAERLLELSKTFPINKPDEKEIEIPHLPLSEHSAKN